MGSATDREEVIKGLEDFIQCYRDAFDDGGERPLVDALALLKSQEPQVLSFDVVKAISKSDSTVYVERRTKKFYEEMAFVHVEPVYGESVIFHGQKSIFSHSTRDYGKEYRCWTSRPSKEQMEATPWKQ